MKNLGTFTRPNGKTVYRQFWSDNANTKETMIWVATEFAPDNEENHVSILETNIGMVIQHNNNQPKEIVERDFSDVLTFVRQNPNITTDQLQDALFEKFDFCDM